VPYFGMYAIRLFSQSACFCQGIAPFYIGDVRIALHVVKDGSHTSPTPRRMRHPRLKFRRGAKVAKVAIARHLAVRLYWMLRQRKVAPSPVRTPESPAQAVVDASPSTL